MEGTRHPKQQEIDRLLHRIERNCEAMVRIVDELEFPAMTRAIHRRMHAFANREEQLMWLVGPGLSHAMAFHVLERVLNQG